MPVGTRSSDAKEREANCTASSWRSRRASAAFFELRAWPNNTLSFCTRASLARTLIFSVTNSARSAAFSASNAIVSSRVMIRKLAKEALRRADAVCFDFDSTIIMEEGIDELAKFCGKGQAVAEWTRRAMDGSTKFEDALRARLDIIKPSRADVAQCPPPTLSPGVVPFIQALQARAAVHIVSGGFRQMIEPVAAPLGIKTIFANTLLWDSQGQYLGFDETEPTATDGGKPRAVARLKEDHGYEVVVMIGDGATDLQAKPPADAVIGYGGVVERDIVKQQADWFVTDFNDLIAALREES